MIDGLRPFPLKGKDARGTLQLLAVALNLCGDAVSR